MFTGHMKRISHTLPGILAVFFMLSVTITVLMSRARLSHLISTGYEIRASDDTLSEETAHSTVYHHLRQQSSCITTAQRSLR